MPTVSLNGKECFYRDIGNGFPLLFGHSFLWDSHMWEPQLECLANHFRCIVPDLWDHGKSGHLEKPVTTMQEIAEDYWKLMKHLAIEEFAVVGLSVGGMWGTELTLQHPKAVKALVLMDTFVGKEPALTQQKYFAMLDMMENAKQFPASLESIVPPLFFAQTTLVKKPHLVDNFRQMLLSMGKERMPGIVALGRAIFSRECLLDKLAQIAQPALVIVGAEDIPRPPQEAEEMASRLRNGRLHIVPNAGHICTLEQPNEVTSILLEFLKPLSSHAQTL